jgi:hypothetical protein
VNGIKPHSSTKGLTSFMASPHANNILLKADLTL